MTDAEVRDAYVEAKNYSREQGAQIDALRKINVELGAQASKQTAIIDALVFKIEALEKKR